MERTHYAMTETLLLAEVVGEVGSRARYFFLVLFARFRQFSINITKTPPHR